MAGSLTENSRILREEFMVLKLRSRACRHKSRAAAPEETEWIGLDAGFRLGFARPDRVRALPDALDVNRQ
jgi:hypothetical protein